MMNKASIIHHEQGAVCITRRCAAGENMIWVVPHPAGTNEQKNTGKQERQGEKDQSMQISSICLIRLHDFKK